MRISEIVSPEPKTVAIFGGSGATGRCLIDRLIAEGYSVKALCRSAASLEQRNGLTIIEGELADDGRIAETILMSGAVIILFGPRPPYSDIFCADATRKIIQAMCDNGVRRLICQTGSMVGDYPANRTLFMQLMCRMFNRRFPELASDRVMQESAVIQSGLEWTIIKPPRLTYGEARRMLCGTNIRIGLLSSISRASIAQWLTESLQQSKHMQKILFLKQA